MKQAKKLEDLTGIEMWAIFIKYGNEPKYRELIEKIKNRKEAIRMADAVLTKISQDEEQRWAYYQHEMAVQDDIARVRAAVISGKNEERAKAEKEKDDAVIKMLKQKMPYSDIEDLMGYGTDRIKMLEKYV
jgi:uncharacterized protein YerC